MFVHYFSRMEYLKQNIQLIAILHHANNSLYIGRKTNFVSGYVHVLVATCHSTIYFFSWLRLYLSLNTFFLNKNYYVPFSQAIWCNDFTAGNLFPSHSCIVWPESSLHQDSNPGPQHERWMTYQFSYPSHLIFEYLMIILVIRDKSVRKCIHVYQKNRFRVKIILMHVILQML